MSELYSLTKNKLAITMWILWTLIIYFIGMVILNLIGHSSNINEGNAFLISGLLIGLSALLASTTIMQSILNTNTNEDKKEVNETSNFYLEKSLEEIKNVYDLLKDKNNDRVTWILAARVLIDAIKLSKNIEKSSHKDVYEIQEFQLKHKLSTLFESKEYQCLSFFAGLPYEENENEDLVMANIFSNSANFRLAESSIITLFSFVEYPKDFNDPLDDSMILDSSIALEKWRREGGMIMVKKHAANYLTILIDENKKYSTRAIENTIL